jgi:hypothetical protein
VPDDDECPHGLDRSWCTLCKQAAMPAGVRRIAPRPAPRAPRTTRPRPVSPTIRTPTDSLATLRKVLFHASAYGAWPSIQEHGLQTAKTLAGERPLDRLRDNDVQTDSATIRDQRTLIRANIDNHLTGVDLAGWLSLINDRVFLFAQQKHLTTLLSRYVPQGGQDVVVFHTAKLLAAARGRVEVLTDELAAPEPWAHCPCRGPDTFVPFERYRGNPADILEVAVVGGIDDVTAIVSRVVRYHPDHTTEVLVS